LPFIFQLPATSLVMGEGISVQINRRIIRLAEDHPQCDQPSCSEGRALFRPGSLLGRSDR
ncbi:hypothetical protein, partial [Thauera aminoaromatica]|uniref:hypothetical protein n=1 Tax=Thauera aminoaromatica TaxID=164330 RepID=UPI0035AEDBED